jgi:hypothetical protein
MVALVRHESVPGMRHTFALAQLRNPNTFGSKSFSMPGLYSRLRQGIPVLQLILSHDFAPCMHCALQLGSNNVNISHVGR